MSKYRKYLPAIISTSGTSEDQVDMLAECSYRFQKKWDPNFKEVEE